MKRSLERSLEPLKITVFVDGEQIYVGEVTVGSASTLVLLRSDDGHYLECPMCRLWKDMVCQLLMRAIDDGAEQFEYEGGVYTWEVEDCDEGDCS